VSAVLLPSFPEHVSNPPHIQLSKETVDILFEDKSKKTEVIDIVNTGQSELQISSLQMFTNGLKISLNKSRLQPGESAKLKITAFRSDLLKVRTRPRILMITNDPQKPKVTIAINAK
jgi:archaellum component FlaF (FlaF/FlaG flagellin family)